MTLTATAVASGTVRRTPRTLQRYIHICNISVILPNRETNGFRQVKVAGGGIRAIKRSNRFTPNVYCTTPGVAFVDGWDRE